MGDSLLLKAGLSVPITLVIAVGLYIAFREWQQNKRLTGKGFTRQNLISLSTVPPNILMNILMAPFWGMVYVGASSYALSDLPNQWWAFLLVFVGCDFSYYWEHRCAHKIGFLWRLYHGTHHTAPDYNVAVAYRVSFLNQLLAPAFYLPWVLLGFDPLLVLGAQLFVFHYQAWLHTERIGRLGRLDYWFNTPGIHRVHHSRDPSHRDKNFGAILLVWDHCFGSFHPPVDEVEYGIPGSEPNDSFIGIYTIPWRH